MKLVLFTSQDALAQPLKRTGRIELVLKPFEAIGHTIDSDTSMLYIDLTGLDEAQYKRILKKIKTSYPDTPWGVLELTGERGDPAWFFHEGAADYLGVGALSEGFTSARWKRIQDYLSGRSQVNLLAPSGVPESCEKEGLFTGWKSIQSGTVCPFYLLYIGPENQGGLKSSLGEKRFSDLQNRLLQYLMQVLSAADALLWMQTDASFLFLIPPERAKASLVIEQCLRLHLSCPLVSYERLLLDFSLSLACALHYGEIPFQPPGQTGTLVADGINFIFHLAHQRSCGGRLVISESAEGAIPPPLRDLFVAVEPFEGKKLIHSKRFL